MWGAEWGMRPGERDLHFDCDDLVEAPSMVAFRGVTVDAPAERVWPWLTQVRVAPYSYDWVDNLGRRSPRRLLELPEVAVGQSFTATAGRPVGTIVAVRPGLSLTGRLGFVHMTYLLVPDGSAGPGRPRTRLLLKLVSRGPRLLGPPLCLGDLVMARKQLLTLKRLAEAAGSL